MNSANYRPRPPRGLLVAIAVLLAVAIISAPLTQALIPEEQLNSMILVLGLPFLTTFVAILLAFIYFIFVLASKLNYSISQAAYRPVEAIIIGGIIAGVIGMFQPFSPVLYRLGFPLLLISTLAFIVWTHIIPKGARVDDLGPLSVDEAVTHQHHHPTDG